MSKIVGIDLGTTNSCVSIIENGEPVVIPNSEGARTTPSMVGFTEAGERRVGQVAKRQAVTNAQNTVYGVKRLMGQSYDSDATRQALEHVPYEIVESNRGDASVRVLDTDYTPPEISAMVLEAMKDVAEAYTSEKITEAVITVPAYFDDAQRQATKAAGKIAGLDVRRIINEPTAAAIAYGFDRDEGNERVVVYDLGGGTFDVSILELTEGVFSVRAVSGDTHLGGEDFDDAVIDFLAQRFEEESGIDLLDDRIALQRLKEQAERARHELSSSLETEINLPFIASDDTGPKHLVLTLKRNELEILVEDLVDRTIAPCELALKDSGMATSDIDRVILVGGMTRMPLVQKKVEQFFGKPPHKGVNPDEVVAVGAALQGAALSGEVEEVLLLDVTPLSLGVETGGGVFTTLITRNTTIPTHKSEIFTTSVDNQPFVPIHVLQGEREMAADNKSLARFELTGLPPAPRGVPQIQVNFDIDAEGILHVTAKDLGTGQEQAVSVVPSSGLTEDEVDHIVDAAEQYRQSDEKRRELAELKNNAEALLYTSERACEECADLVDAEIIGQVREDIEYLKELIGGSGDAISIRDALQQLETSAYSIAEAMYGSEGEAFEEEGEAGGGDSVAEDA
ncbi:MAG: molecular chaperone DnaK [Myxococcales bacterium]|nr:molecular chaperone DnaK [Myxococcales bacterium]